MSLFSTPKVDVPQEDPAVTAARLRQQNQADATLTQSIQDDLRTQMQSRLQRFGLVPGAANPAGGNGPSVTSGFGVMTTPGGGFMNVPLGFRGKI